MKRKLQIAIAAGMLSTLSLAQEAGHNVIYERHGNFEGAVGARPLSEEELRLVTAIGPQTFQFVTSESFRFEGNPVKNAPYSAEAVTETTQSLADGNRISRKTKSTLYRDSEGRTRREETLGAIGPWASGDPHAQMISISDPVSKINLILDTTNKTARKMPSPKFASEALHTAQQKLAEMKQVYTVNHPDVKKAEANVRELHVEGTTESDPTAAEAKMHAEMMMTMHQPGTTLRFSPDKNSQKESLGTQAIEGVQAEGTRTTYTIEPGSIGNDLPIKIVSERWYSPELHTVVMSKNSDPRMGDTTYRLTNINRSEPSPSLFQAPPDYTIVPEGKVIMKSKE